MLSLRALSFTSGPLQSLRAFTTGPEQRVVDVVICGGGIVGAAFAAALGEWAATAAAAAASAGLWGSLPRHPIPLSPGRPLPLSTHAAANPLTSSLSVVLVDTQPPVALPFMDCLPQIPDGARSSTLTPSSISLLRAVGAWRALAPAAAPFCDMQVWDSGGDGFVRLDAASIGAGGPAHRSPVAVEPHASPPPQPPPAPAPAAPLPTHAPPLCLQMPWDMSVKTGWWWERCSSGCEGPRECKCSCHPASRRRPCRHTPQSRRCVRHVWRCSQQAALRWRLPLPLLPRRARGAEHLPSPSPSPQLDGGPLVRLELEGGGSLHTRLLVGADGRHSRVRQWARIRTLDDDSQQHAVVATLATSWPCRTAFQRFLPTGPLALLPLRGGYASLIWSCPPEARACLQRALPRCRTQAQGAGRGGTRLPLHASRARPCLPAADGGAAGAAAAA